MRQAWKHSMIVIGGAAVVALAIAIVAHSGEEAGSGGVREEAAAGAALEVVETSEVCMANDRFFGREQIPVEVDGKTYYGCCEGCKVRLTEDESVRFAVDPVTGEEVDKAAALIAARPDGSVLYFGDEESLARFRKEER